MIGPRAQINTWKKHGGLGLTPGRLAQKHPNIIANSWSVLARDIVGGRADGCSRTSFCLPALQWQGRVVEFRPGSRVTVRIRNKTFLTIGQIPHI